MKRSFVIINGALCFSYIAFRLWRLTDSCLWFDEIFSVHAAEHGWSALVWFVAQDLIHPPLFYVFLKIWIAIGGESVLWLRMLSVVFSVAALGVFLQLCHELKLRSSTLLLALAFFTVSGSLIKYAQEVRMYSLLLFLSLLSMWLFVRLVERGGRWWLLTFVNILLVYTHYYGSLVVASEVVATAVLYREQLRRMLISTAMVFVAFWPWAALVVQATRTGSDVNQNLGWIERPGPQELMTFVFNLIEPFYFQMSNAEPSTQLVVTLPLLIVLMGALLFYLIDRSKRNQYLRLLLVFALVPLIIALVASWIMPVSFWGSRHLIVVFGPAFVLMAIVICEINMTLIGKVVIASVIAILLAAFSLTVYSERREYVWCAWEELAEQWVLAPHYAEGKILYANEGDLAYHFWFWVRGLPSYQVILVAEQTSIPKNPAYFLPRGFAGIQSQKLEDVNQEVIWLAFRKARRLDAPGMSIFGSAIGSPITELEEIGYEIADARKMDVGAETTFLIKLQKSPDRQR